MSESGAPRLPLSVVLGRTCHVIEFVQIGPWRTRVLRAGAGEPLMLLAGTGGHLEAYGQNIAQLAQHFAVYAYDYPGHGYTTLAEADLELSDYVEHLVGLMDHYGIDSAHLNGESLGGWIASKFGSHYPERTRRSVLNTPGGTMARPEVMARIRDLSQAAADDPSEERIRARLEWLMADPATVTEELVAVRRAIYSQPGFATSMRHVLCLQDPVIRQRNLVSDEEVGSTRSESLVIWTSDDPSGPASAGLDLARRLEHGTFVRIDGAGHWPQWEQHNLFNDLVISFLRTGTTHE
jgi:2-hydroxy-6-oxonona-2,4-dienedioate hydrolase